MNLSIPAQRITSLAVPALVAAVALVGAGDLVAAQNMKVVWALAAAAGGLLLLYASGNPRLFSLWALMVVIPLDASKRLGGVVAKMGGENSFRFELCDIFILALLAYQLRDVWTLRRPGLRVPRIAWFYVAILAYCSWAMFFGTYRTTAAHELFRMAKLAVLFIVVANELTTLPRIAHAVVALLAGVLLQEVVGFVQFAKQGSLGLTFLGETGSGTLDQLAADSLNDAKVFRVGALLLHPNIYGAFLACMLPFAAGLFLVDRRGWYRVFYLVVLLGGMANLVMSQSRSGWLSCAVALAILGVLMARRDRVKRRIVRPAIAAAVLTLGVLLAFAGPIATRLLDSNPIAIDGRIEYARTAWGMIRAKPLFGWGLNSYVFEAPAFTRWGARGAKEFYEKSKNWLPPVHNIYLLWWSELGIIGLLMHLVLIGWMIRTAVGNLRVQNDMLFAANIACIVGIVALLIDGMLSFTLRINSVLRDVWVMAALIYAVRYWRLANPAEPLPT